MLETVREFISERLANRADAAVIARRHAGFYRALADQADRPLRAAQAETVERMDAEAGNVAVAVRWHLAHDPAPLPHLFRVCGHSGSCAGTRMRPLSGSGSSSCCRSPAPWAARPRKSCCGRRA
jgi:hypothetical protein